MKQLVKCSLVLFLFIISPSLGGQSEFLRDTKYSIQSMKDEGVLTLKDTLYGETIKAVVCTLWNNDPRQHWFVKDFQSLKRYEITSIVANTSYNSVTYSPTRNVYTLKRQWNIISLDTGKYKIKNPESDLCLENPGMGKEVYETMCDNTNTWTKQIWKFKLLGALPHERL